MKTDILVKHPDFGESKIWSVEYDTGEPIVTIQWNDGCQGHYRVEELEFFEN